MLGVPGSFKVLLDVPRPEFPASYANAQTNESTPVTGRPNRQWVLQTVLAKEHSSQRL